MTQNERLWNAIGYAMEKCETAFEAYCVVSDKMASEEISYEEYRAERDEYRAFVELTNQRTRACKHAIQLNIPVRPCTPKKFNKRVPLTKEEQETIDKLFAEMEEESK